MTESAAVTERIRREITAALFSPPSGCSKEGTEPCFILLFGDAERTNELYAKLCYKGRGFPRIIPLCPGVRVCLVFVLGMKLL